MKEISNKTPLRRIFGKWFFNCDHCGLEFSKYQSQVKQGQKKIYCSVACRIAGTKIPIIKKCIVCWNTFIVKPSAYTGRTTCSKECHKEWMVVAGSKLKPHSEKKRIEYGQIKINCLTCNKEIWISKWRQKTGKTYYCNRECYTEYRRRNEKIFMT